MQHLAFQGRVNFNCLIAMGTVLNNGSLRDCMFGGTVRTVKLRLSAGNINNLLFPARAALEENIEHG